MFHSGTQRLIDVWAALPETGRIPARTALDPVAIGRLLPQAFLVERDEGLTIRLAGGWIEALHGEPLKGRDWLHLWRAQSRPMVNAAVTQAFGEARPVMLASGATGLSAMLEIVVAPMRGPGGAPDRLLGLYQWTEAADRDAREVGPLSARLSIGVGALGRAALSLVAVDGRRIA